VRTKSNFVLFAESLCCVKRQRFMTRGDYNGVSAILLGVVVRSRWSSLNDEKKEIGVVLQ
jgi:hypothetical protein